MQEQLMESLQKVYEKLMNLEDAGVDLVDVNKSADELEHIGVFKRDFGMEEWDWPQGVGLFGLSQAKDFLKNNDYEGYLESWYRDRVAQGLPSKNINTTAPLLTLMDFDFSKDLAQEWIDFLMLEANRTKLGGFQHDVTGRDITKRRFNSEQIWVDTLVMTNLFVAKMGVLHHNDEWKNEALYQLLLHIEYLFDKKTNLFYHGWSFANNNNFGNVFWCRGNAWATIGIPLTLEILGEFVPPAVKQYLLNVYRLQVDALVDKYLDPDKHMWHTVLTNPDSYLETSGTAGILAGIFMGMIRGYLPKEKYAAVCRQVLKAVLAQIDEKGVVHGVSAGTPIMKNEAEYMDIVQAPIGYGQALTLLMLSTALKFYQSERETS